MKIKILIATVLAIIVIVALLTLRIPSTNVEETIDITPFRIGRQKKENEMATTPLDPKKNEQTQLDSPVVSNVRGGILPAFAVVRCRWKKINDGTGERTIHFWVRGRGSHVLEWQTWDDYDGDGVWDNWGQTPPKHSEWITFLFPIRHFRDQVSWGGYPGQSRVMVKYWLDGKEFTKTFYLS